MTSDTGGAIAPRKVTISTSGVVPVIPRVAREVGCSLALSLHGTTDAVRSEIVPLNRTWGMQAVMEAVRQYTLEQPAQPLPARLQRLREREALPLDALPTFQGKPVGRRQVMFEYVMLKGVNDSMEDAARLAALTRPFKCHVNLIPFNPWPGSQYECTEHDDVREFGAQVLSQGVSCTIRWPKGRDIMAACGQLHSESNATAQ
jgi:23S rRNA (adenine2503-C2)-methyltransferase